MSRLALSLSRLADAVDAGNSSPTDDGKGMKRVRNASDSLTGRFSANAGRDQRSTAVDALATQLRDEGAKSFVKSWNDLMAVISSKSAALEAVAR